MFTGFHNKTPLLTMIAGLKEVFFFFLLAGEGGCTIQRQDEPKGRQGHSKGKWGYDPWEILKSRLSVNAIFAF